MNERTLLILDFVEFFVKSRRLESLLVGVLNDDQQEFFLLKLEFRK